MKKIAVIVFGIMFTIASVGSMAFTATEIYNRVKAEEKVIVVNQSSLGTGDYLTTIKTVDGFGNIIGTNLIYMEDYLMN